MIVYHGSDQIVEQPVFGAGKEDNDYGTGFYLTEDKDKANAWAVVNGTENAYCNAYELPMEELNVLHLDDYGVLTWIAEVTAHRGVIDEDTFYIAEKLVDMYKIDTAEYDVIIGYRADDSYIKVIDSFLKNQLTADEVERFFRKAELGEQVFIKSQRAFQSVKFIGYEPVVETIQYQDYDAQARREVESFLNNRRKAIQLDGFRPNGMTVQDVLKKKYEYERTYRYYHLNENKTMKYRMNRSLKPEQKTDDYAYDRFYLSGIMKLTRFLFHEFIKSGHDFYGAVKLYMEKSPIRLKMDQGSWSALNKGIRQLYHSVDIETVPPNTNNYMDGILSDWMADVYTYMQWRYRLSSAVLVRILPPELLGEAYYPLHETGLSVACEKLYMKYFAIVNKNTIE